MICYCLHALRVLCFNTFQAIVKVQHFQITEVPDCAISTPSAVFAQSESSLLKSSKQDLLFSEVSIHYIALMWCFLLLFIHAFLSPPSVFAADPSSTTSLHTATTSDSQLKLRDEVTEVACLHGRKE